MSTEPTPAPTPDSFRRYRLIAELGQGGMADVFLAASPEREVVVIKQLRTGSDPTLVTMFLDEVRLAARLLHPNIVKTFEVVQQGPRTFMVMEYLDGPSLSRLRRASLKAGKRMPLWYELKIIREALRGLHAAHELKDAQGALLNVVHRDFTPQNVMTTFAGEVKIVDFGVAKMIDQQSQTTAGMFKGKLTYAPPEQLLGQPIDRRADVFAAGVMLYEAVTGESPWAGKTNAAITHALSSGQVPRLLERADAPPELAAIIDQAMAVDPDDRYPTALALREALDSFVVEQEYEVEPADLATFVSTQLADSRDRTRATVASRLKILETLPTADTLGGGLPTLEGGPPPEAKVVGRPLPQLMSSEALPDTGQSWRLVEPPTKVRRRRTALVAAAVGGFVAVLALGAFALTRQQPPPAPVVASPTPAPVPPAPTPPPVAAAPTPTPEPVVEAAPPAPVVAEPVTVSVRLSASPAIARLFLDDVELPTNPFDGEFPKDNQLHRLVAKAPGHLEVKKGLQFDRDVSVDVALPRALGQRTAAGPRTPPTTGQATPTAEGDDPEYFKPKPGKKPPKRQLDTDIDFQ